MNIHIKTLAAFAALALALAPAVASEPAPDKAAPPEQPAARRAVDLAICLDTSGSMDGLIDACRQKIWTIVNDLALAKPTPDLRVGLITFGNDGHVAENGWVLRQTDLTSDLDLVSDKLFGLTTNGGTELVGRAVNAAVKQLSWSKESGALKLIVVAGNESADQDRTINFRDACRQAIGRDVMVNSIYCGNPSNADAAGWKEVATLADGHFATIDQNQGTVVIATPFDAKLTELSALINTTYVPYGAQGAWSCENQQRQDDNATGLNEAAGASRAVAKGSSNYRNGNWDLVDASRAKDFKLAEVKTEDLPEAMRKMTLEERKKHLDGKAKKRKEIQAEIAGLDKKRRAHIDLEMRKSADGDASAFDFAVRKAIREQAKVKGFTFVR